MHKEDLERYPFYFIIYYFLFFTGFAIFGIFIPVYLDSIKYSQSAIGLLLSIGPVATLLGQPIWGTAGDRSKNKVTVLRFIILGIGISIAVLTLSTNYVYLLIVVTALTFFQSALSPTSDAITLEELESSNWKYGPIRAAGTLGYIVMAVGAGIIAKKNINSVFLLYVFLVLLTFASTFMIPAVSGHLSKKSKLSLLSLIKNQEILVLMFFVLVTHSFIGFYNTFFPIYFKHLSSDNTLVGISFALAAISEIPFVFFGDRLLERFGAKRIILGSTIVLSIRWLLLSCTSNKYSVLLLQLLHGPSLVLLLVSMVIYVSRKVPKELKVSGQTLYAMVYSGIARIIGSALGGILSDKIGIKYVFLIGAVVTFLSVFAFRNIFSENENEETQFD